MSKEMGVNLMLVISSNNLAWFLVENEASPGHHLEHSNGQLFSAHRIAL